jgi:hypothetical protein
MTIGDEESKAIQEVAKTAARYEPAVRALGEFVGKVIGYPLTQAGGLLGDGIGIIRSEILLKYQERVQRIMKERKLDGPRRTIPLSVVYPLLEAASLEQDDDLSEMFAQLLVNAIDDRFSDFIPKSFVETIRAMSPLEALVLKRMTSAPESSINDVGMMYTAGLPDNYLDAPTADNDKDTGEPPAAIALALSSLRAAGCVEGAMAWGGFTLLRSARVTEYGRALIRACSAA